MNEFPILFFLSGLVGLLGMVYYYNLKASKNKVIKARQLTLYQKERLKLKKEELAIKRDRENRLREKQQTSKKKRVDKGFSPSKNQITKSGDIGIIEKNGPMKLYSKEKN